MDTRLIAWTRRRFLSALAALSVTLLAACTTGRQAPTSSVPQEIQRAPETASQAAPAGTAKPVVAIARCEDYGPSKVEAVVRDLVEQCGGLGTNRLEEIEMRGLSIDQARFPFTSCPDLAEEEGRRMYVAMGAGHDHKGAADQA